MTTTTDRCGVKRGKAPGSRRCGSTEIAIYYVVASFSEENSKVPVCGRCWDEYGGEAAAVFERRLDPDWRRRPGASRRGSR